MIKCLEDPILDEKDITTVEESEKIGEINWKSTAFYRNYEVNKQNSLLTNDLLWSSNEKINKNGFVTEIEGILKNVI